MYKNGDTDKITFIPRHTEIDNDLCKEIKKQLSIK